MYAHISSVYPGPDMLDDTERFVLYTTESNDKTYNEARLLGTFDTRLEAYNKSIELGFTPCSLCCQPE